MRAAERRFRAIRSIFDVSQTGLVADQPEWARNDLALSVLGRAGVSSADFNPKAQKSPRRRNRLSKYADCIAAKNTTRAAGHGLSIRPA